MLNILLVTLFIIASCDQQSGNPQPSNSTNTEVDRLSQQVEELIEGMDDEDDDSLYVCADDVDRARDEVDDLRTAIKDQPEPAAADADAAAKKKAADAYDKWTKEVDVHADNLKDAATVLDSCMKAYRNRLEKRKGLRTGGEGIPDQLVVECVPEDICKSA